MKRHLPERKPPPKRWRPRRVLLVGFIALATAFGVIVASLPFVTSNYTEEESLSSEELRRAEEEARRAGKRARLLAELRRAEKETQRAEEMARRAAEEERFTLEQAGASEERRISEERARLLEELLEERRRAEEEARRAVQQAQLAEESLRAGEEERRAKRTRAKRTYESTGGQLPEGRDCLELGIASTAPDEDCRDYERVLTRLREALLAYNKPSTMYRGDTAEVSLAVDPRPDGDPVERLEGLSGEVATGETKIARHMSAELRGSAFAIEPAGAQRKLVTESQPVQWWWHVTAEEAGEDQLLVLDVFVHIKDDQGVSPPVAIRTFRDRIRVDVTTWDRITDVAAAVEPVHAIAAAAIASIGSLWGVIVWWRRRGKPSGR